MKKILLCISLLLVACGPSPEELLKTADFEVLQQNYPHATKLYQRIIAQHPESSQAAEAAKRLAELTAQQPNQ